MPDAPSARWLAVLLLVGCRPALPPADRRWWRSGLPELLRAGRAERSRPRSPPGVLAYAAVGAVRRPTPRGSSPASAGRAAERSRQPAPRAEAARVDSGPHRPGRRADRAGTRCSRKGFPAPAPRWPSFADSLEQARLAAGVPARWIEPSRRLGQQIGTAILAWAPPTVSTRTRSRPYRPPTGNRSTGSMTRRWTNTPRRASTPPASSSPRQPLRQPPAGGRERAGPGREPPKAKDLRSLKAVNPVGATSPGGGRFARSCCGPPTSAARCAGRRTPRIRPRSGTQERPRVSR